MRSKKGTRLDELRKIQIQIKRVSVTYGGSGLVVVTAFPIPGFPGIGLDRVG